MERMFAVSSSSSSSSAAGASPESPRALPPPAGCAPLTLHAAAEDGHGEPPSPREAEMISSALGAPEHLAALIQLAMPPPGSSDARVAALEAGLEAASGSLAECQQQQSLSLQRSVAELKETYRARLVALEAEFVRQAGELSSELADAVAEAKDASVDAVASHASRLTAALERIRLSPTLPPSEAAKSEAAAEAGLEAGLEAVQTPLTPPRERGAGRPALL